MFSRSRERKKKLIQKSQFIAIEEKNKNFSRQQQIKNELQDVQEDIAKNQVLLRSLKLISPKPEIKQLQVEFNLKAKRPKFAKFVIPPQEDVADDNEIKKGRSRIKTVIDEARKNHREDQESTWIIKQTKYHSRSIFDKIASVRLKKIHY